MFEIEEEAEHFRRGEWEVDCVEMTLTQNGLEVPARFVGQGYLRQKEGGTVHYHIYPISVTGVAPFAGLQANGVSGVLIEPHRYYHLEAVAQDGRCWQVDRTIPEMGGSFLDSGFHHLVGGAAREDVWSDQS